VDDRLSTLQPGGSRWSATPNEVALALGQSVDDQFVTVFEEPEEQVVGQRVVERDGDPV
jgi:hypothetical protein